MQNENKLKNEGTNEVGQPFVVFRTGALSTGDNLWTKIAQSQKRN